MMNRLIGQLACSRYIASTTECTKNYIRVTSFQSKASDNQYIRHPRQNHVGGKNLNFYDKIS